MEDTDLSDIQCRRVIMKQPMNDKGINGCWISSRERYREGHNCDKRRSIVYQGGIGRDNGEGMGVDVGDAGGI